MRVLMLLSNPFVTDARVYQEARSYLDAGHEVTVLCWDKSGEHRRRERVDGIEVVRIRNTRFMDRLHDLPRYVPFWNRMTEAAGAMEFDLVHSHDLDTLPVGARLKRRRGTPLVYDSHEIFVSMIERWTPRFISAYFWNMEKRLVPLADLVVVADSTYLRYFRRIGARRTRVVMNCKPLPEGDYVPPDNDVMTLLYIGTLTKPRFIIESMDVVSRLEGVRLKVAGYGPLEEEIASEAGKMGNVEFLGRVMREEVLPTTLESDAVLCMIDPSDVNNRIATANKQFEAMVCGRPVIATRGTYSGVLTKREGVGVLAGYDKDSLAKAIVKLRDDPGLRERLGRRGLAAARRKYNWEAQAAPMIRDVEDILERKVFNR